METGVAAAPPHSLVRVRGGALMLFTALCISLPTDAQHLLPVLLWLVPSLVLFKVPQLATSLVKRVLDPLFVQAVSEVTGMHHADLLRGKKGHLNASHILNKVVQLTLTYMAGRGVAKLIAGGASSTSPSSEKTQRKNAADAFAPLSDAVVCARVLAAAEDAQCTPSPARLRGAAHSRVQASLFATTTSVALRSFLYHVLGQSSRHAPVTLYVPGLLTAPWTTHLVPALQDVHRRYGARIVGYDLFVDAQRYEVDLDHLRHQEKVSHTTHSARRSSPTSVEAVALKASATAVNAAPRTTAVLLLASVRGRRVHNRDAAFEFAKCRGWQVVELSVPTLPPNAADLVDCAAQGVAQVLRAHSAQTSAQTFAATTPDMRITAFDDAGMHGGAVVHLCVSDQQLLTHMQSECQVGLADLTGSAAVVESTAASPARGHADRLRALSTTTADFTMRSGEYLTQVWLPWAGKLYSAVRADGLSLLPMAQRVQTSLAASQRILIDLLPHLSFAAPQRVTRLLAGVAPQGLAPSPAMIDDGNTNSNPSGVTAESTVEERTTVVSEPLAPLSDVAATPSLPAKEAESFSTSSTETDKVSAGAGEFSPPALLSSEGGGISWASGALTSWMARLPTADTATPATASADAELVRNTPAEWRIRLRWTALLMATYAAGVTQETGAAARTAAPLARHRDSHLRDVCAAAFVSLWSFVTQLPPWVAAVSAEAADALQCGSCVEVAPTAVLLRVAAPASASEVAQLLRDGAAVDARAVSARVWGGETGTGGSSTPLGNTAFTFEESVVMSGCERAAAVSNELLYVPLSPAVGATARAAILRVLWDVVPRAGNTAKTQKHAGGLTTASPSSTPMRQTLSRLYRSYLSSQTTAAEDASERQQSGVKFRPLQPCNADVDVAERDAERARRVLFRNAKAAVTAVALPPSFVTDAATSLVVPLKSAVVAKLLSKL